MAIVIISFVSPVVIFVLSCPILTRIENNRHIRWTQEVLGIDTVRRLTWEQLKDAKNGIIVIRDDGFRVHGRHGRNQYCNSLKWDQVSEIKIFKRDLFAIDLICWWFCCPDDEHRLEINESMFGYDKLLQAVESRFGVDIKKEEWAVALPAFETNMTPVWQKTNQRRERNSG